MKNWLVNIAINATSEKDKKVATIYQELLTRIVLSKYRGACHDTSAMFHILLKEAGIDNSLCIGEMKGDGFYFDHSWVEIDGSVYDAAICMPLLGGVAFPPVFKSIDLDSGENFSLLEYGVASPQGFDDIARGVYLANLGEYATSEEHKIDRLWFQTADIACSLDLLLDPELLKEKYSHVRRELKSNSL